MVKKKDGKIVAKTARSKDLSHEDKTSPGAGGLSNWIISALALAAGIAAGIYSLVERYGGQEAEPAGEVSPETGSRKNGALKEIFKEHISGYYLMMAGSQKAIKLKDKDCPISFKIIGLKPGALFHTEPFAVDKNGKCTSGKAFVPFEAGLLGFDKNHMAINKQAEILLHIICGPDGRITSYDEWEITDIPTTSKPPTPKKSRIRPPYSDNKAFHKPTNKRIALKTPPRHVLMRSAHRG